MKKALSIIITLALSLSFTTTGSACADKENEYVNIHGYQCYEKEGNYWTQIDGEEYLVIDVNQEADSKNTTSYTQANTRRLAANISTPPLWTNNQTIDLTDGSSYDGRGDITSSDYCTPVFEVEPTISDFRFSIYSGFWLNTKYNITIYVHHQSPINEWHSAGTYEITFNLANQTKVILLGTAGTIIDGFAVKYLQSSTGEDEFDYRITPM